MVEYLDKQVEVVTINCVKNGEVIKKAKDQFCIDKLIIQNEGSPRDSWDQKQQEQ
jgi:hypothetical protein